MTTPLTIKSIKTVSGRARGRHLGTPTINIDLSSVPRELEHGIYACWIDIAGTKMMGAMHYGPRPAFADDVALEVHVLDQSIETLPKTVSLEIVAKIRDVQNFESVAALQAAIAADIAAVRAILSAS